MAQLRKAFDNFSTRKVSTLTQNDVKKLMKDTGIVRNEGKIRSVIINAQECQRVSKEFGSFGNYLDSFKGDERRLIADLRDRFRYLGESSARTFLYMSGFKLKPTTQELQWHSRHMRKES